MLAGVDYYPEHWPRERWDVDADLMARAGIQVVRLAEFAWALMEPREGHLDFGWLDEAIEVLARRGIRIVLGTPTATPPAWLVEAHPEVLPVDEDGVRVGFGGRRHYCPTVPTYREYARRIVTAMAEHYHDHPAVVAWQIDNELACHRGGCHCAHCRAAFQEWLRRTYGSLEALNDAWGTAFWSQVYTGWAQIPLPGRTVAVHNPSLRLDHMRFVSDSFVEFQAQQIRVLREKCPTHRVTTNLMGLFDELDYFDLARSLDFVSWDNYPAFQSAPDAGRTALAHDLMRSLKHQRFWVMEQQAGPTGWDGLVDPAPKPGQLRLWTWQAVAHGAEAVVYFRWRTAARGAEQFWHGILDHDGTPRRRYDEIRHTAGELSRLPDWLGEARMRAPAALMLPYEDRWAWRIQPQNRQFTFERRVMSWYRALWRHGIGVEAVSPADPLDGYRVVIVPSQMIVGESSARQLETFVERGGILVVGPRSAIKDLHNRMHPLPPPGPLADALGCEVEEYDSLAEGESVEVEMALPGAPPHGGAASVWCDVLAPRNARAVAHYRSNYYAGKPAVAVREAGRGTAIYVGSLLEQPLVDAVVTWVAGRAALSPPVEPIGPERQVETCVWEGPDGRSALFVLNHDPEPVTVRLSGPWRDHMSGETLTSTVRLEPYGVKLLVP